MTLRKDDVVELIRKDDDGGNQLEYLLYCAEPLRLSGAGWWLVRKDGVEGWAPYNYLELIPPETKPPPPPPANRKIPSIPASGKPISVATPKPVIASVSSNGSILGSKHSASGSILSGKPTVNATSKPRPPAPVAGSKPAPPKIGQKPPVPNALRPVPATSSGIGKATAPKAVAGQMDLATMVSINLK
jgi:myosin I